MDILYADLSIQLHNNYPQTRIDSSLRPDQTLKLSGSKSTYGVGKYMCSPSFTSYMRLKLKRPFEKFPFVWWFQVFDEVSCSFAF